MKSIAVISTLLGLSAIAHADAPAGAHVPPPVQTAAAPADDGVTVAQPAPRSELPAGYLALDATAGIEAVFYAGLSLNGGLRIARSPLYLRGQIERGKATQIFADAGTYNTARLGLEARACGAHAHLCVFGGVDGGLRRAEVFDDQEDGGAPHVISGPMVFPRAGLEVGGTRVRGRLMLELPTAFDDNESFTGVAVTAGVGYAF